MSEVRRTVDGRVGAEAADTLAIEASDDGVVWHELGRATPAQPYVVLGPPPEARAGREDVFELPALDARAPFEATCTPRGRGVDTLFDGFAATRGGSARIAQPQDHLGSWKLLDANGAVVASALSPYNEASVAASAWAATW